MNQSPLPWSEEEIRTIREMLLEFFREHRRDLPWREDPDPYRILVVEVMSQQTRIETVVPYYRRWMERFPNARTLARADRSEVLALWEGLGYYTRARNLHRAARELESRYGGQVPSEPEELLTLPGIGPYTAGAVASIAFGVPAPAVDGNARRVLARLTDRPSPSPRELERWASALVDPLRPGDFNQSLMELGSRLCTPRSPECGRCPLVDLCRSRAAGTQEERPAPRKRKRVPKELRVAAALVMERGGKDGPAILLHRRPEEGLLGGLWELPGQPIPEDRDAGEVALALSRALARAREPRRRCSLASLSSVRHLFSHLEVTYLPFLARMDHTGSDFCGEAGGRPGRSPTVQGDLRWISWAELEELPVSVAQRKILALVAAELEGYPLGDA
jgi:A/G-specific adenine glycosylase